MLQHTQAGSIGRLVCPPTCTHLYVQMHARAHTHTHTHTHTHRVRRARHQAKNPKSCDETFERLITEGVDPDDLYHEVTHQTVEIVLTAHPTQVNRRTLQYKHSKIAALLQQHDR
jgi:phosphoenolpyruvate carboxylase